MVASLRHKRSAARLISPPFPTSSSTMIFETADGHRSSGDSQIPSDGYSSLFTSGFMRQPLNSPTLASFPSPPKIIRGPFHPASPAKSPEARPLEKHLLGPASYASPQKTPVRRRRSSIIHTTPMSASPRVIKAGGADGGVERALDNVMKSLKVMAMGTPRREIEESRWSSSSEESLGMSEESGFWKPRKSGESTRSKMTVGTYRSGKSIRSKKSRKSEDTDRMEIDEDIPPVPVPVPSTPGRSRRMMNGLVKRLGLTPKKNSTPASTIPDIPAGLPPPPPERSLPRKTSLSTLRSALSKKTSTGTLRSVKSTRSVTHPFVGTGPTFDCEMYPPPLPSWKDGEHGEGCLPIPTTPRGRRTPKSSIGHPRLQPSTSPSIFLKDMPRRAPGTPKRDGDELKDMPSMPDLVRDLPLDTSEYGTPRSFDTPSSVSHPFDLDTPSTKYGTPTLATPMSHVEDGDALEVISFGAPLTSRAAALKPKRLVDLLPRQQRVNLGLQTPPPSGLRSKKSTVDVSTVLGARDTPLGNKNINIPFMDTPESLKGSPRDPLGIMRRFNNEQTSNPPLRAHPFKTGGNEDWGTPSYESPSDRRNYFQEDEGTFGHPPPPNSRPVIPDFTVSPGKSSAVTRNSSIRSMNTEESYLPSEEWELEAYLKELERVDREREVGVGR